MKLVPRYSIGTERPPDEGMFVAKVNGVDSYFYKKVRILIVTR